MNNNILVVSKLNDKYMMCHICNDKMIHFYAFDSLSADDFPIGTIVNGRVTKRLDNANGSFVALDKNNISYINKSLKPETVLPVVVKKEATGNKKRLVSEQISITGEYVVVSLDKSGIRVSNKLNEKKSNILKEDFSDIENKYPFGILFRTKAGDETADLSKVRNELIDLCEKIKYIKEQGANRPSSFVFYKPSSVFIQKFLLSVSEGACELVSDCDEILQLLSKSYEEHRLRYNLTEDEALNFRKYDDKLLPLNKLYSFEGKISELLSRKLYLKNGASIYIDKTEALTAIDVNSASEKLTLSDKQNYKLNVNIIALREIVRQIQLRNISGIIIIDFINMDKKEDYDKLAEALRDELAKDKTISKFHGFTSLGLAEVSRQRKGLSINEMIGN